MREIFLTELIAEVLGPRNGIHEIMNSSPLSEYITGVLAPVSKNRKHEIDSVAEIPFKDTQVYEEETDDIEIDAVPLFSPPLDPKKKPHSMGLSFIVRSDKRPNVRICLTWARYKMKKKNETVLWIREPRYSIFSLDLDQQVIWINSEGESTDQHRAEISFHVITKDVDSNCLFVSLYLVNRIDISQKNINKAYLTAEEHIFQPQIRVSCSEGTEFVTGRRVFRGGENKALEFLYREQKAIARGHVCSAVWRDIDPENMDYFSENIGLDFPECREKPPFRWYDSELLDEEEKKIFSPSDARTEFVPIYQISGADFEWASKDNNPEFRAEVIAETWRPEKLKEILSPFAEEYEKWINKMTEKIGSIPDEYKEVAQRLIENCEISLQRIKDSIELLCSNDDVRLSFCFSNKAIDLQYRWKLKSGEGLIWRPFQLAFILMTLESIVNSKSRYRKTCDLLWIPTGGGKTEAYLAIAAFTMAYRRKNSRMRNFGTGTGLSVITRYTLRLLTIQQFRRSLAMVSACEYLRVYNLGNNNRIGWRPDEYKSCRNFLWGSTPFLAGLWVGGQVTPNRLRESWIEDKKIPGALNILKGEQGDGEPAQVLNCPACGAILAVPEKGLHGGTNEIHLVFQCSDPASSFENVNLTREIFHKIEIMESAIKPHRSQGYFTLSLQIESDDNLSPSDIDNLWGEIKQFFEEKGFRVEIVSARASRPGYFIRWYISPQAKNIKEYNFEVFCPNPDCSLNVPWCAGAPSGWVHDREPDIYASSGYMSEMPRLRDGNKYMDVQKPFRLNGPYLSDRIPIPALIVDDQVYHWLPSILVATIDKFARPPFEPRAAAFFGNVRYHHCIWGYYRLYQHPEKGSNPHPGPKGSKGDRNYVEITPPRTPDLILQDELHLIEGPLGSIAGIYETAVDFLSSELTDSPIKYIASTATVRNAEEQVKALFLRDLHVFPPNGFNIDDRFFIRDQTVHPLSDSEPGRLYVGICAPGKGPLTPVIRIWARLLQTANEHRDHPHVDPFWTLTGYFNAVRELAGTMAVYRQDIPLRINDISRNPRQIDDHNSVEISSRISSTELPAILNLLNEEYPNSPDALFATSMLGTGVDISRISLMVVHGQPKTTSSYIQSTGRVGRRRGALVPVFLKASRPRDLNHYEFFCGYHHQLHRFVEPVTVYPFAPGVIERSAGPVGVFILRNMRNAPSQWHRDDSAPRMRDRRNSNKVLELPRIMEDRAQDQPSIRKPQEGDVEQHMDMELDRWKSAASNHPENLKYVEYTIFARPQNPVVLGDHYHRCAGFDMVYENVPQSFRDIEETTGFET